MPKPLDFLKFARLGQAAQAAVDKAVKTVAEKHRERVSIVTRNAQERFQTITRQGEPRCFVCGCTEFRPCEPPCAWDYDESKKPEGPICTTCSRLKRELVEFLEATTAPAAGVARLYASVLRTHGPLLPGKSKAYGHQRKRA